MGSTCCSASERKNFAEDHPKPISAQQPESLQPFYNEHKDNMQVDVKKMFELQIKHGTLIEIRLVRKRLDQKSVEHLVVLFGNLNGLKDVSLVWTSLTGATCRTLMPALVQHADSLDSLCLNNNDLRDGGAETVASVLPKLHHLHKLLLDGNEITDKGAAALIQSLSPSLQLTVLSLQSNKITAQSQLALVSAAASNSRIQELSLQSNKGRVVLPTGMRADLRVTADLTV